jgi:hypothetical protein
MTNSRRCPDDTSVECGGKRSATPLSQVAALLDAAPRASRSQSGVALRLPPQSKAALSAAVPALLGRPRIKVKRPLDPPARSV